MGPLRAHFPSDPSPTGGWCFGSGALAGNMRDTSRMPCCPATAATRLMSNAPGLRPGRRAEGRALSEENHESTPATTDAAPGSTPDPQPADSPSESERAEALAAAVDEAAEVVEEKRSNTAVD